MPWRLRPICALSPSFARIAGPRQCCRTPKLTFACRYKSSASAADLPASARHDQPSIAAILDGAENAHRDGKDVTVAGNVRTIRNQRHRSFLKLGDGSTIHELQAILDPSQSQNLFTGAAVTLEGRMTRSPGAEQAYELSPTRVVRVGPVDPAVYPLQKKYHTPEFLRTLPHLRPRLPLQGLLARLRSDADFCATNFFRKHDYVRVTPPVITSSDCEGAGEVFTVQPRETSAAAADGDAEPQFFRVPKFLTVSAQLHLEALAAEHRRVWTLAPTFRAERSDTARHLSEFYMLEAELQTSSLDDLMLMVEGLLWFIAGSVSESRTGHELLVASRHGGDAGAARVALIERRWRGLDVRSWPRITYCEAIELLGDAAAAGSAGLGSHPSWGSPLHVEHERYIAETVGNGSPVFVTHYPRAIKPFYMLPSAAVARYDFPAEAADAGNRSTAACFDLLLPGMGEVVGGSLREHRLEPLTEQMRAAGLLCADEGGKPALDWYLDLRRYGSVPHGGFGLGFDRLLGYLSGVDNVREVVPWPRYFGRCDG